MIRHRFIRSCAAVFVFACLGQGALAAESNSPVNSWAVGAISSETNGRYCSMKTLYQEGQELVFVRDKKGETSIGIDFRKDMLSEGYRYDVSVRVGNQTRKLAAIGATKQVIVMKVGADKVFFAAFKDKNVLSFSLTGKKYDFALAGASAGLKALDICADRLKSGGKFKQVTVSSAQKLSKAHLEQQKKEDRALRQELDKLKADNRKFMETSQSAREAIKADILRLQEENRKLAAARDSEQEKIKAEIERLKKENEELSIAADIVQEENSKLQEKEQKAVVAGVAPSMELPESLSPIYLTPSGEMQPQVPVLVQQAPQESAAVSDSAPVPVVAAEALPAAAPAPVAAVEQAPEKLAPAPVPEATVAEVLKEPESLKDFLRSVGIYGGKIEVKEIGSAYRWVSDNIFGSAQSLPAQDGKSLRDSAEDYLNSIAVRCKGNYAQKVGDVTSAGSKKMLEAELACLDKEHQVAAAVLFVADQGDIHVIMQEGATVQMPAVLSQRDSIEEALMRMQQN